VYKDLSLNIPESVAILDEFLIKKLPTARLSGRSRLFGRSASSM
jgi:hypothetical protein